MKVQSGTELINPFKLLERVGIRQGQRVADLGCGALGHFVFPAAQLVGANGSVFAVDIQRSVLEQIEKRAKDGQYFNVFPVWSDIDVYRATRIEDASLDLTLLINNLYLSQNREGLIREMARLARPGSRIIVVEWKPTDSPLGPPVSQRLDKQEAKKMLKSPLIEFQDDFEAGPYHYGMIYERTDAKVE
ncbi:methyltransferase domain-containing protein [Candidatus Uhrbacteria bacterium]|nr:methyltransferase domain-containing protein [Candidatus Uhrbacteria bacterium]